MLNAKQRHQPNIRRWDRLVVLVLAIGLALWGSLTVGTSPVQAFQNTDSQDEVEPVEKPDGADDSAADTTDTNAGAAEDEAAEEEDTPQEQNYLSWALKANGLIFGPILMILSFIMVALVVMNFMQVRRDTLLPPAFIESFEQQLAAKDYQGAYETARSDDSIVARVLAAGLSRLNRGYNEAIEGMQEVGEDENMALEHRLSYLALIGTIAPMVGLMGTVYGMINSFQVIATSTTQPKPADLADGISTALFTTLEGLAIAIPAMVFYSLLRNQVARLVLEIGIVSEGLMSRFAAVGKRASTTAGGGAPATAPAAPKQQKTESES